MADEQVIEENTEVQANPELEAEAREMGWRPSEEFQGDKDKWVDAVTFVERGKHVLPIVKATADRLRTDLTNTNKKLGEVTAALAASQESMAALDRYHQEDVKRKVENERKKLLEDLAAAKRSGDVEGEVALTDNLTKLNASINDADNLDKTVENNRKQAIQKDYSQEPEFVAWKQDNAWFNTDMSRTAISHMISAKLRGEGNTKLGRAFLDDVSRETAKGVARLSGSSLRMASKSEGSRGGAGGSGGGGNGAKGYSDLPAEAKQACASYERDVVGKDRKFATIADWRKKYAEDYFAEVQ